jgi:excisionase family DNA binding protein
MTPALLTRKEAAKYLAVSETTIKRLPLRKVKIGTAVRYAVADLDIYISLHTVRKSA